MRASIREITNEDIEKAIEIDEIALCAKESEREMEHLMERFQAYLRYCTSRYGASFDESHREEMYGSAMVAFYEAVQKYDQERGHFFPFASQIIKARLIDYIRKTRRQEGNMVSLDDDNREAASSQSEAISQLSIRSYENQQNQSVLAEEIEQLTVDLSQWGISMYSLTEHSPKHQRLREEYDAIVQQMLQAPDVMQTIQLKHYFPVKTVAAMTGTSVKKLERARNYIIASVLILMGDYTYLSEYVSDRRYTS